MNTKEIREYIACPQFGDDHYGEWGALRLDQRLKIKHLLDYITNLEEENKKLEEKNKTFEDYNKDLNRQIDKLEEDLDAEKSTSSNLAQRLLKAIEYINENKDGTDCCGEIYTNLGEIEIKELLKILKGEENESNLK